MTKWATAGYPESPNKDDAGNPVTIFPPGGPNQFPPKLAGLRATVWRERCCSNGPPLSDVPVGRVMYLGQLTMAPGRATREVVSLTWGSDASGGIS